MLQVDDQRHHRLRVAVEVERRSRVRGSNPLQWSGHCAGGVTPGARRSSTKSNVTTGIWVGRSRYTSTACARSAGGG